MSQANHEGRGQFDRRVRVLGGLFLVGLVAVALRAFDLQVLRHERMESLAKEQYLDDVRVPARRGHIHDRNGKALAISLGVPSVYANPSAVTDPRQAARALAEPLEMSVDLLYRRLATERAFVWLKRQVSPEVEANVRALGIEGLGVTKESRRFYPNRELAANIVGFTGVDGQGLEGIERELEKSLAGEPQVVMTVRDARGNAVLSADPESETQASGADVFLTIDSQIQHAAETALRRGVAASQARGGMAVVLDVASGEVLAMAVAPTFNPNDPGAADIQARRNRAVTDVFEPGSIMKPLVLASAVDRGVANEKMTWFCENGSVVIDGRTIRDTKPHGNLGLHDIIAKSSNICAAKIGQALGRDRLAQTLEGFGFGERTGIDLPGEVAGLVRKPSTWSAVHVATISFGQGVATTALQMAAAYRVLAAGGSYIAPSLVRRIEYPVGGPVEAEARAERRVVSNKATQVIARSLERAVHEGTGARGQVPGYRVAGKTGTAQKVDSVSGGYSADEFVASFAGYLPVEAPRVVIVAVVDEPRGEHSGGVIAAPVFAEIGEATMRILGVVPSQVVTDDVRAAIARMRDVVRDDEAPALDVAPIKPGAVPSFLGLTARQAIERYVEVGVGAGLSFRGSGVVVEQQPTAGSAVQGGITLVLGDG